jgi:NAD(P)-dependent dehydrogenase (short-subunit alcohol dehydrogenase family)
MKRKSAIITGASTGIGRAIVALFLEKGYNVVMNAKNEERLQQAFQELGSPMNAVPIAGDIGRKEVGDQLVSEALKHFKGLDILINNAGVFQPKTFLDVSEKDLDFFLTTNLKGTFFTSQAAIRHMVTQRDGDIVNIGTVLVDHAIAGFPATAPVSSKGAIHALTRQLASEFGRYNIRINTIAPGIIRSPLQGKIGVDNVDSLSSLHLLNRVGEPHDIAQMAYFLTNSTFITGEIFNVDGGHVAGHQFG